MVVETKRFDSISAYPGFALMGDMPRLDYYQWWIHWADGSLNSGCMMAQGISCICPQTTLDFGASLEDLLPLVTFPLTTPKANFDLFVMQYANVLLTGGSIANSDDAIEFLVAFLQFILIKEGQTKPWKDALEHVMHGAPVCILPIALAKRVHIRWAAVRLVVEGSNWYPWSVLDFGTSDAYPTLTAMDMLARWEVCPAEDRFPLHFACLPYSSWKLPATVGRGPKGWIVVDPGPHVVCSSLAVSPDAAAIFARFVLLGGTDLAGSGQDSSWHAISAFINWMHGTWNAYSCCGLFDCYVAKFYHIPACQIDDVQPSLDYLINNFYLLPCIKDGSQAWIAPADINGEVWLEAALRPLGIEVNSFDFARRYKVGNSWWAAPFSAATLSSMNIPVQLVESLTAPRAMVKAGPPVTVDIYRTKSVALPFHGMQSLPDGDLLWGPGGTLFDPKELFLPHGHCPVWAIRQATKTAPEAFNFVDIGGNFTGYLTLNLGLSSHPDAVRLWQSILHVGYLAGMKYFLALFGYGGAGSYASIARDAMLFYDEPFTAGGALHLFASRMDNPSHPAFKAKYNIPWQEPGGVVPPIPQSFATGLSDEYVVKEGIWKLYLALGLQDEGFGLHGLWYD